jgi:hypothetical protein
MQAIFSLLAIPFVLLNMLGGIVSGIWLAVLGQWWAIGYGIAAIFFSSFAIGLAMMPGLIFAAPAAMLAQKGKLILAFPLMLLSQFYTYVVIIAWCIFVFNSFVSNSTLSSFWPLLIWSYGVALSPLTYMSQREQQAGNGEGSVMTTFFAQIAYVVMAVAAALTHMSFLDLMVLFSGLMVLGMLIQTAIALAILVEQKRLGLV